jgi:hypothetical protein
MLFLLDPEPIVESFAWINLDRLNIDYLDASNIFNLPINKDSYFHNRQGFSDGFVLIV